MKAEDVLIPKQIKVDNTEKYRPGMSIVIEGDDHIVYDVLNINDLAVIRKESTTIH